MSKKTSERPGSTGMAISAAVETKLADTLFDQPLSIVIGQAGTIFLAGLAYAHSGAQWILVWTAATVAITAWRFKMMRNYARRSPTTPVKPWLRSFAFAAALTSLGFGLAASIAVLHHDSFVQMIIVTGQGAYVSASAVRNNAVPGIAKIQTSIPLGLLAVACLASRDPFMIAYSVLVLLHFFAILEIINFLSRKTRDMLVAQEEAAAANRLLEALTTTDPLTGIVNRRGFDMVFSREFADAAQNGRPLSLLLLDIDHFKALNDAFGHQRGDECLRALSRNMCETMARRQDVVCRYGGEEFAIVLPDTDDAAARIVAERVRRAIEALAFRHPTSVSGVTTVSIGYAVVDHAIQQDGGALIKRADEALYRAKASGRNRVVAAIASLDAAGLDTASLDTASAASPACEAAALAA